VRQQRWLDNATACLLAKPGASPFVTAWSLFLADPGHGSRTRPAVIAGDVARLGDAQLRVAISGLTALRPRSEIASHVPTSLRALLVPQRQHIGQSSKLAHAVDLDQCLGLDVLGLGELLDQTIVVLDLYRQRGDLFGTLDTTCTHGVVVALDERTRCAKRQVWIEITADCDAVGVEVVVVNSSPPITRPLRRPHSTGSIAGLEVCELFDGTGDQKHAYGLLKKVKLADKARCLENAGPLPQAVHGRDRRPQRCESHYNADH